MKNFLLILLLFIGKCGISQYNYLGSYTSDGLPLYLTTSDVISAQTLTQIKNALPEGFPVPTYNPQYISSGYDTDIRLLDSADVWVTFVDEGAGYKNVLGFYTYDLNNPITTTPSSSAITIIFPNVSKAGSGGSLLSGNKVKIGTFSANTGIGFILIANGWSNGAVGNGNWKLYSNPNFNPETTPSLRYHNALISDSTNQRIILGFEDIRRDNGGCDNDFNDALFYITASPYTAIETYNFAPIESANSNVSSGNNGGLESNGKLADKIAKQLFLREKNNTTNLSKKENQNKLLSLFNGTETSRTYTGSLAAYFPASGMFNTEEAFISTPADLTKITNATDVFSVDYYIGTERVSAALVTHTDEKVYDHSKIICDRLNGASVLDIRKIELRNFTLINTTFKNANGEIEYSITFSVKVLDSSYSLYSLWNIDQYTLGEYLNFQIWGHTMGQVCSIADAIIQKLETEKPVVNNALLTQVPNVFIKEGAYKNGKLLLTICNKKQVKSIIFSGNSRSTETGLFTNTNQTIALTGSLYQQIEINSGYLFDIGLSITYVGNVQLDALYLADGAWGTDYVGDMAKDVIFSVSKNEAPLNNQPALYIERNTAVSGKLKGTFNLFRNTKSGNLPLDISKYTSISFDIECNYPLEVVLVNPNLSSWEKRARFWITSTPEKRNVTIPLLKFTNNEGAAVDIDSIKTIVFTLNGDFENYTAFDLKISNVNFNSQIAKPNQLLKSVGAFPNPFARYTTLTFPADTKTGQLIVSDENGRVVFNESIKVFNGEYSFDAQTLKSGIYIFSLKDEKSNKNTGKLIIQK
jgi:hypothetical protein